MLGFGSRVCFAGFGFLGRWLLCACLRTFLGRCLVVGLFGCYLLFAAGMIVW